MCQDMFVADWHDTCPCVRSALLMSVHQVHLSELALFICKHCSDVGSNAQYFNLNQPNKMRLDARIAGLAVGNASALVHAFSKAVCRVRFQHALGFCSVIFLNMEKGNP